MTDAGADDDDPDDSENEETEDPNDGDFVLPNTGKSQKFECGMYQPMTYGCEC
jgi:hypothetical protein